MRCFYKKVLFLQTKSVNYNLHFIIYIVNHNLHI